MLISNSPEKLTFREGEELGDALNAVGVTALTGAFLWMRKSPVGGGVLGGVVGRGGTAATGKLGVAEFDVGNGELRVGDGGTTAVFSRIWVADTVEPTFAKQQNPR